MATTTIRVNCPECGRDLKIKDPGLIGRRGKCPSCSHVFVLEQTPEAEVELELAEEEAVPVGTGARWVPEPPALPQSPIAAPPAEPTSTPPAADAPLVDTGGEPSASSRLAEIQRKKAKRRNVAILAGAATAFIAFGLFLLLRPQPDDQAAADHDSPVSTGPKNTAASAAVPDDLTTEGVWFLTQSQLDENEALVEAANPFPADPQPIELYMMPSGINFVLHLRPAELWSDEPQFQQFRATLTQNVTDWIAARLKEVCRREPAEIEEALIGVMLGARGTEPQISAVVRLQEEARLSDLVEEFRGEPLREEGGLRLYRAAEHAYLIRDAKTIAICPASMGEELAEWVSLPNYQTTDGVLQLLNYTDRRRLFTVVMEVDDVRRHEEWLFPEGSRTAFQRVLDIVSDDVETACWTVHLGDRLHSDLIFRTRIANTREIMSPRRLAEVLGTRFEAVPQDLMEMARMMHPPRKGARTIIGRFPAMVEVYRQATVPTTGARFVRLTTLLPAKAAPNLALGTLLTWDEAGRSDFSGDSSPPPMIADTEPDLPETVAERLELEIDAEFSRTPLQDAFLYIAEETGVQLDIDGDALKDAGYTQNMPQTYKLGMVPASEAIHAIIDPISSNDKEELRMAVCIDEESKSIIVTTKKFAVQRGLTIHLIGPEPEAE